MVMLKESHSKLQLLTFCIWHAGFIWKNQVISEQNELLDY